MVTLQKSLELEEVRLCSWKERLSRPEHKEIRQLTRCWRCNGYATDCRRYKIGEDSQ